MTALLRFIAASAVLSINKLHILVQCLHAFRRTRCHEIKFLKRSVQGLSYHSREGDDGVMCSLAHAQLIPHFPTFSNPYFLTIEFTHIRYYGPWASGCCGQLKVRVRLPRLNQTWCRACIDDLRVTVKSSEHIPDAVVRLRENLLSTIVLGEEQRFDDFVLATNTRLLWSGEGMGVVAEARGYEVTITGKKYDFGRLKGSLMRDWDTNQGVFLLTAEDVLWHNMEDDDAAFKTSALAGLIDILCYPVTLVSSFAFACQNPASILDLQVTRGEIKFRKFRNRDHSLGKHAMEFIGEWKPRWMDSSFVNQLMWDAGRKILA